MERAKNNFNWESYIHFEINYLKYAAVLHFHYLLNFTLPSLFMTLLLMLFLKIIKMNFQTNLDSNESFDCLYFLLCFSLLFAYFSYSLIFFEENVFLQFNYHHLIGDLNLFIWLNHKLHFSFFYQMHLSDSFGWRFHPCHFQIFPLHFLHFIHFANSL